MDFTAAVSIDPEAVIAFEALSLGTPVILNSEAALAFAVDRNLSSAAKRRLFLVHVVVVLHAVLAARPNLVFT